MFGGVAIVIAAYVASLTGLVDLYITTAIICAISFLQSIEYLIKLAYKVR